MTSLIMLVVSVEAFKVRMFRVNDGAEISYRKLQVINNEITERIVDKKIAIYRRKLRCLRRGYGCRL